MTRINYSHRGPEQILVTINNTCFGRKTEMDENYVKIVFILLSFYFATIILSVDYFIITFYCIQIRAHFSNYVIEGNKAKTFYILHRKVSSAGE